MEKLIKRSEQKKENTWATEDIFPSDEAWLKAYDDAAKEICKIDEYVGKISQSAKAMYEYLLLREELQKIISKIHCYAALKSDEDKGNSVYADYVGRAIALYVQLGGKASFETPEIISIPDETLEEFYKEVPELCEFKRFFAIERAAKDHTLSPAEEKLLAGAGEITEAPDTISSAFRNADLKFPDITAPDGTPIQVTQGSFIKLMESPDVNIRRQAFDSVYHTYEKFKNSLAAMLDAQIKQLTFFRKARKFDSNIEKALNRTEVPVSVYENLIKSVNNHMPSLHRYMELRKKLMGVEELHMYDLYTPIVADADEKYDFETAKKICREALAPMGEDYLAILDEGFNNRWIDVYENEGKRGGAYSMGANPHPYVLLNHSDTLDSMFTLAHEMGHAIHSYLSKKTQRPTYAGYVIFVAEVASTFNENLLMQHLLKNTTDKKQRAYIINHFLESFRTTLYRQTMFAEFELEINRVSESGRTLTADTLSEIYYELNKKYYGDGMVVDREIAMEWARIPHFYMNFYVYQYATGFSAAVALSQKVLNEGKPAVDDYIGFLKGGCTKTPIELLRGAGIDMNSPEPINDALDLFDSLIDEFEELLK